MSANKPANRKKPPQTAKGAFAKGIHSEKAPPVYSATSLKSPAAPLKGLNDWLEAREGWLLTLIFSLGVLFSFLLFQVKMDLGADDSAYLQRAYDLIHKGIFPTYQGALYPLVLSIFVALFGINVVILKILCVVFNLLAIWFTYKAFKGRIPATVLWFILLFLATNAFILRFSSLTYSEPFFMFLQSLLFFIFFRKLDKYDKQSNPGIKEVWKDWLLAGLFVFLLGFTRTVGLFSVFAFLIFLVISKKFNVFLYLALSFFIFYFLALALELTVFGVHSKDLSAQTHLLLLKDSYDPKLGLETFSGFIQRLIDNSEMYLSQRFPQILGFTGVQDSNGFLAVFVMGCLLFALYRSFRSKNKYMQFICLYISIMLGSSFIALQTRWDQPRIVMVFVPLIVLVVVFALVNVLGKAPWIIRFFGFALPLLLLIVGIKSALESVSSNMPILKKNLKGDIFYGYTPDWVNYLKLSQWCADSLPKDAHVATRKASMSFIYARGKEFISINAVAATDPDSVLNFFRRSKVDYIILASLRVNPNEANGSIINTLWLMVAPVAKKYPDSVMLIHQTGTDEPSYLYKILY